MGARLWELADTVSYSAAQTWAAAPVREASLQALPGELRWIEVSILGLASPCSSLVGLAAARALSGWVETKMGCFDLAVAAETEMAAELVADSESHAGEMGLRCQLAGSLLAGTKMPENFGRNEGMSAELQAAVAAKETGVRRQDSAGSKHLDSLKYP